MKHYLITMLSCSVLCLGFSCNDQDKTEDLTCFAFDQRQCGTDVFADGLQGKNGNKEIEKALKKWLEEQGLQVENIHKQDNFYEAVCEACDICPEQHRFFVQIQKASLTKAEGLNLLNFEKAIDCSDYF